MDHAEVELPVIDLHHARKDRITEGKKIVQILENIGFASVANVDGYDQDELMKCCEWFFNKPKSFKETIIRKQWNPSNKNIYRGYFPVAEDTPTRVEGFDFGRDVTDQDKRNGNWLYEDSVWPEEDGSVAFKTILQGHFERMHLAGLEILRLICAGLGLPENTLPDMFGDTPCSTVRLNHYPPWGDRIPPPNAITEKGEWITIGDHSDSEMITLVTTFGYTGLQILMDDGRWARAKPCPGKLVMNIGDTFVRLTKGRFKATRHRVVDIGVDRFSIPYFMAPDSDTKLSSGLVQGEGKGEDAGFGKDVDSFGQWFIRTMRDVKNYDEFLNLPDLPK